MGLADVAQHDLPHLLLPALGRGLHDEDLHHIQRQGRCVESLAIIDLVLRPEVLCDEPALVDAEVLVDVQPPYLFFLADCGMNGCQCKRQVKKHATKRATIDSAHRGPASPVKRADHTRVSGDWQMQLCWGRPPEK